MYLLLLEQGLWSGSSRSYCSVFSWPLLDYKKVFNNSCEPPFLPPLPPPWGVSRWKMRRCSTTSPTWEMRSWTRTEPSSKSSSRTTTARSMETEVSGHRRRTHHLLITSSSSPPHHLLITSSCATAGTLSIVHFTLHMPPTDWKLFLDIHQLPLVVLDVI